MSNVAAVAQEAAVREAAVALDDKLARWVDDHYMMEYPFQTHWLALHKALYGHDRKPVLSPCKGDHTP